MLSGRVHFKVKERTRRRYDGWPMTFTVNEVEMPDGRQTFRTRTATLTRKYDIEHSDLQARRADVRGHRPPEDPVRREQAASEPHEDEIFHRR